MNRSQRKRENCQNAPLVDVKCWDDWWTQGQKNRFMGLLCTSEDVNDLWVFTCTSALSTGHPLLHNDTHCG